MFPRERPEIYGWVVYGLTPEKFVVIDPHNLDIYISVPEHSDFLNEDGTEIAGDYLAKEFNKMLKSRGIHNYTLKCSIRRGTRWRMDDYERVSLVLETM